MCYIIAETGDCPFCKAIMHYVLHLLELTLHNVSKAARLAGIELQLPLPYDEEARHRPQRVKRA